MSDPRASATRIPRVNAVGLVEVPEGFTQTPREHGAGLKAGAWVVLVIFSLVVVVTTTVSLGAYCLTTDGGDLSELPRTFVGASAPGPSNPPRGP